jgi:CrcB protein
LQILLVALGGILGSILRWQVIESFSSLALGVYVVNQLGVLTAGFVAYRTNTTINQKIFWITGFAGGFTTLSSFAFILHESNMARGLIYGFISLATSVIILQLLKVRAKS